MTDDIRLIGDGEIHFVDIEASASTGRKPRISTNPAYSGGKLDVEWTHPETKERLPVVVDLETLEAGAGLPFVLYHRLDQPLGTIENIAKTQSDLKAEGSFTHGHTLYGANELTAARNGFKHRPSVTVYNPDPKNVVRVGEGERRFINGRTQEGAFFAVYHGKLRNISMESTPGDPACDTRGSILAQAKGVQAMTQENFFPEQQGTPPAPPAAPDIAAQASPAAPPTPPAPVAPPTPAQPPPSTPNIEAGANPQTPAPAVHTASPSDLNREVLSKMYDRGDISPDIMAQAFDQGWTPKQALDAQGKINGLANGVNGTPNIAGFPNAPNHKRDEPNGDMIMAAAFMMEHCGFSPSDFDASENRNATLKLDQRTIDAATSGEYRGIRFSDLCAHAAELYYNGKMPTKRRLSSRNNMELFQTCMRFEPELESRLNFEYAERMWKMGIGMKIGEW